MRGKSKEKKKPFTKYDMNKWMTHMNHLALGFRFQKDCLICTGLCFRGINIPVAVIADIKFYNDAIKSGKRDISF